MTGENNLNILLASMSPELFPQEYGFVHIGDKVQEAMQHKPLSLFCESEGWTAVLELEQARGFDAATSAFRRITLNVHSDLEAVGLTAAVSTALAEHGISANVIAAYFHDHIFVQAEKAEQALDVLNALMRDHQV